MLTNPPSPKPAQAGPATEPTHQNSIARKRFGITFSMLARRWRRVIDRELMKIGLTDATWLPLLHLSESGDGITQKELAALVGVDGSSLVRVLDILERDALIERRRDEMDGRARLVHLTDAGHQRLDEIRKALELAENAMLTTASDAQLAQALDLFSKISVQIETLDLKDSRNE